MGEDTQTEFEIKSVKKVKSPRLNKLAKIGERLLITAVGILTFIFSKYGLTQLDNLATAPSNTVDKIAATIGGFITAIYGVTRMVKGTEIFYKAISPEESIETEEIKSKGR